MSMGESSESNVHVPQDVTASAKKMEQLYSMSVAPILPRKDKLGDSDHRTGQSTRRDHHPFVPRPSWSTIAHPHTP